MKLLATPLQKAVTFLTLTKRRRSYTGNKILAFTFSHLQVQWHQVRAMVEMYKVIDQLIGTSNVFSYLKNVKQCVRLLI